MVMKQKHAAGRLSLRNSLVIWAMAIAISWSGAIVLFYQIIRNTEPDSFMTAQQPGPEAATLGAIAPAAGNADAVLDVRPEYRDEIAAQ